MQGILGKIIMALVIGTLSLFGFSALTWFTDREEVAAAVNGEEIGADFLRRKISQRRLQMTDTASEEELAATETPEFAQQVLEDLIRQKLLEQTADSGNWVVTDSILDGLIRQNEEFQIEGQYDPAVLQQTLAAAGYTPARYRDVLSQGLLRTQIALGVIGTAFVTDAEFEHLLRLSRETRNISWLIIKPESLEEYVSISEAEIGSHYELYQASYDIPEQVVVQYLVLSQDIIVNQIEAPEDEIRAAYEAELAEFTPAEKRQAAHILLDVTEERDLEQAKEEASALRARVEAGEDFADLAKAHSTDASNASKGGDLGMAVRGLYVPAFEKALWELEVDQISEPVATQFGVHLVKLLAMDMSAFPEYAQIKSRLENEIKQDRASQQFAEQRLTLAEISYESDDLEPASEALGLPIKRSSSFSRDGLDTGVEADPAFVEAAFAEDVLREGYNSVLAELADGSVAVVRFAEKIDARARSLAEVTDLIADSLRQQRTLENARVIAQAAEKRLRSGDDRAAVASDLGLEWQQKAGATRTDGQVPEEIQAAAFDNRLPASGMLVATVKTEAGIALVVMDAVNKGDIDDIPEGLVKRERNGLISSIGRRNLNAFQAALRLASDIDSRAVADNPPFDQ